MARKRQIPKKLVSFSDRFVGYLFPFFLLVLEGVLRSAFELDTREFIGPTLAATGVGMVISLTSYQSDKSIPEQIPKDIKKYIRENDLRVETKRSILYKNLSWIFTFILVLLWIWSLILSTKFSNSTIWIFPSQYYPGIGSYLVGFILTEIKEAV